MTQIALIGNPNVGKTTLFNDITGSNQYVGNWPGVTVEKIEGYYKDIKITDLPGIYALDTYSNEEIISKDFLENEKPDLILNIVDASNLERNLYLTSQIIKYNIPIIIALNMMDVAKKRGMLIDPKRLEESLGIKVFEIVASKSEGVKELKEALTGTIEVREPKLLNFESEKDTYDNITSIIRSSYDEKEYNDSENIKSHKTISDKIDSIVLNPILGYPIFLGLMYIVFKFTFSWVGQPLADLLEENLLPSFLNYVSGLLSGSSPWFRGLIVDGVINGVGSILVFLPIIVSLFLGISILEDSGYMARAALIMDRFMRKMGLSGKAFIPLIIGFGCTVPAIMSSRTLETEKDRKLTAILAPFIPCNAKLPIFALFASIFFGNRETIAIFSLYLAGILVAFLVGIIFKNTIFKKDEEPFIIELPEYKMPLAKSLLKTTFEKAKSFIKKAFTIIFSLSILVWFLSNFNFNGISEINDSFLATIGSFIAPIFKPLGFGTWQATVSLITGILAKEVVISTMGVVYGGSLSTVIPQMFTPIAAVSFMVFVLLYTPCVAVIATFKKEYGGKFAFMVTMFYLFVAWLGSFLVYNIGNLIF